MIDLVYDILNVDHIWRILYIILDFQTTLILLEYNTNKERGQYSEKFNKNYGVV